MRLTVKSDAKMRIAAWWPITLTLTNTVTRVTWIEVSEVPGVRMVVAAMAVIACGLAHADLCGIPEDAQVVATVRHIAWPEYFDESFAQEGHWAIVSAKRVVGNSKTEEHQWDRATNDCAGVRVEDRNQFCVRAGGRTCPSTAVIFVEPFLLVPLDVEIDSEGQKPSSLSGQIQNLPANHRLDSSFRIGNELLEVAFLGIPTPAAIVVGGQSCSDKAAGVTTKVATPAGQWVDLNASKSIVRASLRLSNWSVK